MNIKMKRFLSILLSLALVLGLMPGMRLTAYATTYSGSIWDDLQAGDILKPGAWISAEKINVTLQANGWGDENGMSTSGKQFSVESRGLEIQNEGCITVEGEDHSYTVCYPYANGEKVSAWEVVSFDGGEGPWDPKTITLTGYAPPPRTPVTEISSNTTLTQNISGYVTITGDVTLDLAGYTITGGGNHSTIIINNGYTLTLIDSSTGKTGKITGGGGDAGGGVAVGNNATFNMQGGTISGNTATNGGGVALGGGATFTMSGGTITGNSADNGGGVYSSGSSFSMTGGTISNNSAGDFNYGGGVLIQSGNFSMSGTAAITGNDGGNQGGGVYFGGSTFTMSGGSISDGNHASSGGGVYVNSGTFNMTGGTITGNSTDGWAGGGVYTRSIFNMSGSAAITGNSASSEGGGVYQDMYAVFTMTGGSITYNSSGDKGYAGVCIRENGTFNLSGGAVIDGNTHGSTEEDICLYPRSVVKVTGALTMENTMSVRLTDSNGNDNWTGTIAQGSGYTLTETDGAKFIASTTNRRAKYDSENSKEMLVALYTVTYNANGATSGTVPIDENNPYESGSTVTVLGNTGNLAKTSHNFNGWNTAANGSGTPYAADATFNIERNTTLYAQWEEVTHAHDFTYYASGATITATCTEEGCDLPPSTQGGTDHAVSLTLSATDATYSGNAYAGASLSDKTAWTGAGLTAPTIKYAGCGDTSYTESETAPTNAGTYTASITADKATATADFTISPMALTIDAATATNRAYDKDSTAVTISTVTFKDSSSNPVALTLDTDYTVTGAMTDANAGSGKTVNVTVTLKNGNYSLATNTATTTVDISKAAAQTIADVTDTLVYTATSVSESVAGKMPSDAGTLSYTAGDATKTGSVTVSGFAVDENGAVTATLSGGAEEDTVTLPVVISSTNYADSNVNVVITLTDKGIQTITADPVTVTYGDTDKAVSATVTDPAEGGGTISYAVKDGSGDYIEVNAETGALTIKKVPENGTAIVTATAAETPAYAAASTDVTVTIEKANAIPATVTANNRDFDGTEQPLVTVTGEAVGGEMQYALGTVTEATGTYATSIPAKTDAGTYYVWYKVVGDENHKDTTPAYVTTVIKGRISATVTFKVVNGSWNNGEVTTADRKVTLTGYEGDKLMLTAEQIPAAGEKPAEGYKAGAWDVTPSTEIEITQDTTYTYTYVGKETISKTITFKVVNGSWNDGEGEAATADRIVTLTGKEGDVLKLTAEQIPAVGDKPGEGYKTGAWNVTPSTETEIKEDTTFIYTYAEKAGISTTVTFKVVNGSWNDGEGEAATADRTVTLTGKEGDKLMLTADQIPAAGEKPAETYKAGAWNVTPSTETEIKEDTTFIYTYAEKAGISATVTFKVVNGSWNDGEETTADRKVTLTGHEGDQLKLTAEQIPAVGDKPADGYKTGAWNVTPSTEVEIKEDTTFIYTYAEKSGISATVTFKVVNGSWNDGEGGAATSDRTVVLTGKEGDALKLTAEQIPAVGAKPGEGYQAGAWDVTPSTETEIKENTTFIYTYAALKGKSISYKTYEGEGGEYKHGSDGTLTFVFKRSENDSETFARFTGLKYDGNLLTRDKHYTAKAGSVIITLDHELLESMMVGNHILTAVFDDGEADAHFTVIANAEPTATPTATPEPTVTPTAAPTATPTPTPTPKPVPKTGDNSNPVLWLAMMILGLAVLAGTAVKVYRKRQ